MQQSDQEDYVDKISKLNQKNQHLTNNLYNPQIQNEKQYANLHPFIVFVRRSINNFELSLGNVLRGFIIASFVTVIFAVVFYPLLVNHVPYAMSVNSNANIIVPSSLADSYEKNLAIVTQVIRENPTVAQNVTLNLRGKTETFNTSADTVADVLKSKQVELKYGEGVYPNENSVVNDNQVIAVDKIVSKSITLSETKKHQEKKIEEKTMLKGEERVMQEGNDGAELST
jgi:hypothetical protein